MLYTTRETEEALFVKSFELSPSEDLSEAFYLPRYVQFFQVLKEEGITVDREGNSTEMVTGRRYLESWEIDGFSKYGNDPNLLNEAWEDILS